MISFQDARENVKIQSYFFKEFKWNCRQLTFLAKIDFFFLEEYISILPNKTRLKGFSPKREQRLWKLFQISGRDFKVRAKMTIKNF